MLIGAGAVAGSASLAGCGFLDDVEIEEFGFVKEDGELPDGTPDYTVDAESQMYAYVQISGHSGGVPVFMIIDAVREGENEDEEEFEEEWQMIRRPFTTPDDGGTLDSITGLPDLELWEPIRPRPGFSEGEYTSFLGIDHDVDFEGEPDIINEEAQFNIVENNFDEELQILDTRVAEEIVLPEFREHGDDDVPTFGSGDEVEVQFAYTFFEIDEDEDKDVDFEITIEDNDGNTVLSDEEIDSEESSVEEFSSNPSGELVDVLSDVDLGKFDGEAGEYTVQVELQDNIADEEVSTEIPFEIE